MVFHKGEWLVGDSLSHLSSTFRWLLSFNMLVLCAAHLSRVSYFQTDQATTNIFIIFQSLLWFCLFLSVTRYYKVAIIFFLMVSIALPYASAAILQTSGEATGPHMLVWVLFPVVFLGHFAHWKLILVFTLIHVILNFSFEYTLLFSHGDYLQGVSIALIGFAATSLSFQVRSACDAAISAREQFTSSMSHELRTPLNGMLSSLEFLLASPLSKEQERYTKLARSSAEAMLHLVNQVLQFASCSNGEVHVVNEDFSISECLSDVAQSFEEACRTNQVGMTIDISSDIQDTLFSDRTRVTQIVDNLTSNAFKYAKQGGLTMIRYHVSLTQHKDVSGSASSSPSSSSSSVKDTAVRTARTVRTVPTRPARNYRKPFRAARTQMRFIKFTVSDNGPGFPSSKRHMLFQPFARPDSMISGTGLGLFICKAIARSLGGSCGYDGEESVGASFWFTIPYTVRPPAQKTVVVTHRSSIVMPTVMPTVSSTNSFDSVRSFSTSAPSQTSDVNRFRGGTSSISSGVSLASSASSVVIDQYIFNAGTTALVAEDNAFNRQIIDLLLSSADCGCVFAENGSICVDLYQADPHRYAFILMDIQMPVMDGLEATLKIRSIEKENRWHMKPIVGLTADARASNLEACLRVGMQLALTKPIQRRTLLESLRNLLSKEPSGSNLFVRAPMTSNSSLSKPHWSTASSASTVS